MTLVQLSRYTMQVSLSESDIAKVKVGQRATVTVNAAASSQFAAHVRSIDVLSSSSASSTSSAVSYPVTLSLDQTGKKLKAGMSASADIVVAQASGIVVPTQALQGSSVTVVKDGVRSTRQVRAGVAGDASTQILSGLRAGETLIVRSQIAPATTPASGQSTGVATDRLGGPGGGVVRRFGGGGGGGGGIPGGAKPGAGGP
jgi:hypothetical protein